ncbi:MAG: SEC-C metal-binding domain-containing protein [Gemmatimonas sp.]
MNRNDPCPCGSGTKYKKCHGGAVPPEAATLPAAVRTSVLRAEAAMQRNRRITQEILDWADRRLGPEWMDAAYTAWGLGEEEELAPEEGDLFTTWAVYHHVANENGTAAAQWLAAQRARFGARMDTDTVALLEAHRSAWLDVWEVTDPEPGVGVNLRRRVALDGGEPAEPYVYETDASHDLVPPYAVLAYVMHVDDVHVFGGLHDVPLEPPELDTLLLQAQSTDTLPVIRAHWWRACERYFDRLDAADADEERLPETREDDREPT